MKVAVFGAGYVGLVQAVGLAKLGHEVVVIEINPDRLKELDSGRVPFFEEGLQEALQEMILSKNIKFVERFEGEVNSFEMAFICVQTPSDEHGGCDVSAIEAVFDNLIELSFKNFVVIKSTVPPGALDDYEEKGDFELIANPEFLRQGRALRDFFQPERIVIGLKSEQAEVKMRELYKGIDAEILVMSVKSAQLAKYAANTMLASRLSIINEIAGIADVVGADILDIVQVVGSDSRIGGKFLRPSNIGFGGSCFPKDVLALNKLGEMCGYKSTLIKPMIDLNSRRPEMFIEKLKFLIDDLENKKVAIWGLSFNANTDDLRESPALKVLEILVDMGVQVSAYDPCIGIDRLGYLADRVNFCRNKEETLPADFLLVLTEWEEFDLETWDKVVDKIRMKLVFDAKNFLDRARIERGGLEYCGIGICKMDALDPGRSRLD